MIKTQLYIGGQWTAPACDTTRANSCRKGDVCRVYAGTLGFCAP